MNVFVNQKAWCKEVSFSTIFRGVLPFIVTDLIRLVILIAFRFWRFGCRRICKVQYFGRRTLKRSEVAMLRFLVRCRNNRVCSGGFRRRRQPDGRKQKRLSCSFYDAAINQKDFEAASKFIGPRYVQHNPRAADGLEG